MSDHQYDTSLIDPEAPAMISQYWSSRTGPGAPNVNFGKYLFEDNFEIQNFRNICCKISFLPVSPRIFEHLKNGIIAHF